MDREASSTATNKAYLVIELGHALVGPYAGAILSDLGARMIKVEPLQSDLTRLRGSANSIAYPFQMIHCGKYTTAIDIKDPQGSALVKKMTGEADIVVENFRPGVLKKYDLDGDSVLRRFPHIVYCSISGFGKTGPMAEEPGVDLVAQGQCGLMSVTGMPGEDPVKAGFPIADLGGGMWAVIGMLAALQRARATGKGTVIDVALTDSVLAWSVWEAADYQATGIVPGPLGSAHRLVAPYRAYECAGGHWINVAGLHTRWRELCLLLEAPNLLNDPRFASESARYDNRELLDATLAPRFLTRGREDWLGALRALGIPCGPINDLSQTMSDAQFIARDMWRTLEQDGTAFKVINTPVRDEGGGAPGPSWPAPALGTHTLDVLRSVGIGEERLHALLTEGIIGAPAGDE